MRVGSGGILSDAEELLDGSGGILSDADEADVGVAGGIFNDADDPPVGTGGGIRSDADDPPVGTGGMRSDADERDVAGSGGIVVPREGGAVIDRTGGAGGTSVCVPDAERVRGNGATSPCATGSGAVIRAFGGLNIRSSPGSLASGFWVETISMSSLTAVDSVFAMFKLRQTSPRRIANAS